MPVWGSDSELQAVQFDKERLWVTRDLAAALMALPLSHRAGFLWIDSLPIKQSSLAERASQVKQMQRIYSHARDTLIMGS